VVQDRQNKDTKKVKERALLSLVGETALVYVHCRRLGRALASPRRMCVFLTGNMEDKEEDGRTCQVERTV
jgi:hypothetical protein